MPCNFVTDFGFLQCNITYIALSLFAYKPVSFTKRLWLIKGQSITETAKVSTE